MNIIPMEHEYITHETLLQQSNTNTTPGASHKNHGTCILFLRNINA